MEHVLPVVITVVKYGLLGLINDLAKKETK